MIWFSRFSRFTRHGLWETGGIDQLLKMFQRKSEGNSRSINKKMLLSYGRIFLVTFSKPVQRKSVEDSPVATPEFTAV
ncbi:MAG: hypothetical protein ACREIG_05990 [Nitrospiraceae bacterium]